MADLHKVGSRTPQAVIYKSESHKLHQAFPVKKDDIIVQGQPVKLNNDGTISPYTGAEGEIPYYAILEEKNQQLYEKYKALTEQFTNFHLLGRLAEYKYYNIDAMCRKAMELVEEL